MHWLGKHFLRAARLACQSSSIAPATVEPVLSLCSVNSSCSPIRSSWSGSSIWLLMVGLILPGKLPSGS